MNMGLVRRWLRWVVWAVICVCVLWVISWAAVPRLVQWQVEKQATQILGRVVKIDQVLFHPWSMVLTLQGLQVAHAGPAVEPLEAQLSVDEIEVNASLQSLLLWAPVADAIVVRNPQLQLTHKGQGHFDIDDLLALRTPAEPQGKGFPRMSLFNIQVVDGGVRFRDEPRSITHTLTDLRLDIPFLSNIGGRREVATQPRLAFTLNGTPFDTDAQTTPFAKDRNTHARFQIKGLDVRTYLPYWPAAWPVRLAEGQLEVDLALDFRQLATPEVAVSGRIAVNNLRLNERLNPVDLPLLSWASLDLNIQAWRPLDAVVQLDTLRLDKPVVHLRRDPMGQLNSARLQSFFAPVQPAQTASPKPPEVGGRYALKQFAMTGGQLNWQDTATPTPVNLSLTDLSFQAQALSWPSRQTVTLEGKAQLQGASLAWTGTTDLSSAQVRILSQDVALKTLAPYWAQQFHPELTGKLAAELNLDWRASVATTPARLVLKSPQIRVTGVSLGSADKPDVAWAELALEQVEVDVFQHKASLGRVALTRPMVNLSRNAQSRWMAQDWLVASKPLAQPTTPPVVAPSPWQLDLGPLQITGGELNLDDRFVAGGVKFDLRDLNVRMGAWQPLATPTKMTPIQLDFSTGAARREPGKLGFEGALRWPSVNAAQTQAAPLQLKGQLKVTRFPLHRFKAYAADRVNLDLRRADVSYAGGLDLTWPAQGLGLDVQGQLTVENLRALNPVDGEALVDVQTLSLSGLKMGVRSGALQQLKVSETALRDFFARVAIDEQGQVNLQSWLKPSAATDAPSAAEPALIELGPIGVVNGRVLFSDRFIRPNYSADITELAGSLGALSNQSRDVLADLSLRGKVAGTGSLQVTGRINPLTRPVALDVRGQVRDLELPQLSPYSSKYAGYGIERGKLSAEVNYRVGADGQLEATHQITLQQLRFGERSDSADAPNLPVKLAAALLADRNGVIDLNLPVSGSINDPDFRVGPTVWRMVLSLIGKAILSPFSLLSGALAGADQLQQIDFAPGQSNLDAAARNKLESVAKLVIDKPALRLSVVGQADLDSEREAWRQVKLQQTVSAEQRRRQPRNGQTASLASEVSREEYPALLQSVYRRSPLPKPRNVLGLVKDLSVAEMEALLLAAITVDERDMRELAQARAEQVRAALLALKVPAGQLFSAAPVVSVATGTPSRTPTFVPKVVLVVSTE